MSIEVQGLTKTFGGFTAVDDVSFRVKTGSLTALLGPSGSGKSTLLRVIAGLESADRGKVLLTGEPSTARSARERNVGFVFQHYALFKHMTVRDNIGFGLAVRRVPSAEINARVKELMDLVQLSGFGDRFPSQLSGGQRQRVALARALAPRPGVMLLDEPFGALDAKVREDLRRWIRRLHDQTGVTTILVTHDQHEALEVAERVLVMDRGRLVQEGSPSDIFDRPVSRFVAEFVGESNYVEAVAVEPGVSSWGALRFSTDGVPTGGRVRIYFRPHDVYVSSRAEAGQVAAVVRSSRFRGALTELDLDLGEDRRIVAQVPKGVAESSGFDAGKRVFVHITAHHAFSSSDDRIPAKTVGFEGMNI